MASATRLRHRSRQWTARPGSGRRSFFSSHLCLYPCWHRCLWLRLIVERPRVSLTKQEKPRAARPTEPRDSYAFGIRIPHSSPSAKSNSRSDKQFCYRQISPDTRNKGKRNAALQHDDDMFGPRRPQKTYAHYKINCSCRVRHQWGSSSTLGVDSTFGGIRPGLERQHGRRISTSKEPVGTTPGPSSSGSPPGTWPEQTARPAVP
jgi:hypothetical protein